MRVESEGVVSEGKVIVKTACSSDSAAGVSTHSSSDWRSGPRALSVSDHTQLTLVEFVRELARYSPFCRLAELALSLKEVHH